MWSDFSGKTFTREQLAVRVAQLTWTDWKPIGITLHNTAAPTLAQWAESGAAHDARIKNLQSYYEGLGWHGGPHWFVSRNFINEFSNPLRRGTHSPSFNATHLGIEMVGDYAREPFNSGDGAKVRDNAVFLMALLCRKFGFDPDKNIVLHKEDPRTSHDCPGKFVVKSEVIMRVKAEIARQSGKAAPQIPDKVDGPADPPPTWKAPDSPAFKDDQIKLGRMTGITATVFGFPGDEGKSEQRGAYGQLIDANKPCVALPFKFPSPRPKVRVFYHQIAVVCDIVDRGPWNLNDDYWNTSHGRPRAEMQYLKRSPAENNRVPTNDAGIDLSPGAARKLGLIGKGKVDWEFVGSAGGAGAAVGTGVAIGAGGGAVVVANKIKNDGLTTGNVVLIGALMIAAGVGIYFLVRWLQSRGSSNG